MEIFDILRFKRDFNNMVLPNVKPAEASFTLRQCLSESIRTELSFYWIVLFLKFSDLSDWMRAIVESLFVEIIDRGYRDLKRLSLEQEICNSHVLAIIEGKLPREIQIEWHSMIHKQKVDIKNRLISLYDFLKIERAALEYGMSELRINTEQKYGCVNNIERIEEIQIINLANVNRTWQCVLAKDMNF